MAQCERDRKRRQAIISMMTIANHNTEVPHTRGDKADLKTMFRK
jgi:hypothetical protein